MKNKKDDDLDSNSFNFIKAVVIVNVESQLFKYI